MPVRMTACMALKPGGAAGLGARWLHGRERNKPTFCANTGSAKATCHQSCNQSNQHASIRGYAIPAWMPALLLTDAGSNAGIQGRGLCRHWKPPMPSSTHGILAVMNTITSRLYVGLHASIPCCNECRCCCQKLQQAAIGQRKPVHGVEVVLLVVVVIDKTRNPSGFFSVLSVANATDHY